MLLRNHKHKQTTHHVQSVFLLQCCVLILLLAFRLVYSSIGFDYDTLIYLCCVAFLLLSAWLVWSWKLVTRTLFDPYILFVTAAILFNGGQLILQVFHLNETGILNNMFSSDTLLRTILVVTLGLASFHVGGLLSVLLSTNVHHERRECSVPSGVPEVRYVGWGLLLVSLVPSVVILREAAVVVLSSGYFGLYEREVSTSFDAAPQIVATFLLPAALFLLAGSEKKKTPLVTSGCIVLSYAVMQLFFGYRGAAVMPLIAYAWLWHRSVRPIPKVALLFIGTMLIFVVFPLVGATRNVSGGSRLSIEFLRNEFAFINNPVLAIISEMGSSMKTVAYTIDLVPTYRSYDLGLGYLYALLTVFPNIFGDLHPAVARGLPSAWLTWTVEPHTAARGGGLGFSFIAEAYLNFGWFGSTLALGIMGLLFGKLTRWATKYGEPAKMAMLASFLSFFLFFVRQEAAGQVRPLLWYAFFPYVGVHMLMLLRSESYKSKSKRINDETLSSTTPFIS